MGVAWHSRWENFGLITSAEGLVRELVAYDKIPLVRAWNTHAYAHTHMYTHTYIHTLFDSHGLVVRIWYMAAVSSGVPQL